MSTYFDSLPNELKELLQLYLEYSNIILDIQSFDYWSFSGVLRVRDQNTYFWLSRKKLDYMLECINNTKKCNAEDIEKACSFDIVPNKQFCSNRIFFNYENQQFSYQKWLAPGGIIFEWQFMRETILNKVESVALLFKLKLIAHDFNHYNGSWSSVKY